MKTKVTINPISNPLPHESKSIRIIEFKDRLSRSDVFKILFPRLAELGHDEESLIVSSFRVDYM